MTTGTTNPPWYCNCKAENELRHSALSTLSKMCKYGGVTKQDSVFYWLKMEKGGPGSTKKKATEMSKVSIHWMSNLPIYVGCGCSPCHPTPGQDLRQEYSNVGTNVLFMIIIYCYLFRYSKLGSKITIHVVLCSICWRAWVLGWKLSKTNFTFWICSRRFWRSRIEIKFIKKTNSLQFHQ